MSSVRKYNWSEVPSDPMAPGISRQIAWGEQQTLARLELSKGAVIPLHQHPNEQVSLILSGSLRVWLGADTDHPAEEPVDLRSGEMLLIPGGVWHRAEALEDTIDLEVFSPPRDDWAELQVKV